MTEPAERLHTVVLSDLHLTEAEPPDPRRPLWKRYKRREHFIDASFQRLLEALQKEADDPVELVLGGDIFDFDAVMAIPEDPPFPVSWLERRRGLDPEEAKSRFKMEIILRDHPVWVAALRAFLLAGHRLVIVVGNHDLELEWPAVQQAFLEALDLPEQHRESVRFCDWFYVSGGDTLIEHGNQYDAYCMCQNPVRPYIEKGKRPYLRLPFGNLAGRLMLNGMGLFNPHVESSFVMSFREYVVFFFRHMVRVQPLLVWTWFWGAAITLARSLDEGLRPALKDPLTYTRRIADIAARSGATSAVVLALRQLHEQPAIYNPVKILRELWLDRALILLGLFSASFQLVLIVNAFTPLPLGWALLVLALFLPMFIFYARSVQSDVYKVQKASFKKLHVAAEIAGVSRVIHGHTHRELHTVIDGVEHLNTGTWSPAFRDPECREPLGRKCFVWLRPGADGERQATLFEWADPEWVTLSGREEVRRVEWLPTAAEEQPALPAAGEG